MVSDKKAKAEELKRDADVRRAFEQTAGNKPARKVAVRAGQKFWLGTYVLLMLGFGTVFYLLRLGAFDFAARFVPLMSRLVLGAMAVILALILLKVAKIYIERLEDGVARFNLNHVANLLAGLTIFFIGLSVLFANWYTAVVSLGLISLILGLALQTPISSLIGWVYILIKVPYKVGDRIRMGEATGDVIDVSYLDTTLWEFGGQLVASDHPTGRIIKFPNSSVLGTPIYNYSWSLFPYIWNDIKFMIAYQSDLEFVSRIMREAAEEEVGEEMIERVSVYRELLAETPVDQLEVQEHPVVIFRVSDNTWIEAIVRYLVEPRRAGQVKTRLIKTMLERLNSEPGKVMFPKGDMR